MKKERYNIAVIGATGNVGREVLSILDERNFPVDNIYAVASSASLGKEVSFGDQRILKITTIDNIDFKNIDIAFFAAGSKVSKEYGQKVADAGCIVIDKAAHFRMNPKVPLIVPEVNPEAISKASIGISLP